MRANLWTSLGTVGPGFAVRSLICLVLATGCNPPGGPTDGPTGPVDPGPVDPTPPPAPPNQQPRVQQQIEAQELQQGADTTLNMGSGSYFSDPDGDQLTYSATSQPDSVVAVTTSGSGGSMVTIRGVDVGTGTVSVTATDPGGLNTNQSFNVTVTERPVGVCMRTPQVRDAILAAVGVTECASVTLSQLAGIDSLDVSDSGLSSLREDDFELLPELTVLRLGSNGLSQLPRNVFSDLDNLEVLDLSNNSLQELRAGVFSGLSSLKDLEMHNNDLSSIQEGAFSGLSSLRTLGLDANQLSTLDPTVFSGLDNVEVLDLSNNRLPELRPDVFANLSSLRELRLHTNQLSALQTVFPNLPGLELVDLSNNSLGELPVGAFSALSGLKELRLATNQLQSLPRGVFVGLSELRRLTLEGNPGTPFGLALRFERTDATSLNAPPPATVRVVLAEGAPFAFNVILAPRGGAVRPSSVPFAKGDTLSSRAFTVSQTSAGNPARITVPRLPDAPGAITGVQLVAPDELVLFGGTNRPPTATGGIQPSTLTVGSSRTTDVANLFTDPDGDALAFSAVSSAPHIATASMTGSTVRVVAVAAGTATVTVTATDPNGLTASLSGTVTVIERVNQAPEARVGIRDITRSAGWSGTLELEGDTPLFVDPDGDELTYSAESSDPSVATVSVTGSVLRVATVAVGTATGTVTATDPGGLSASVSFNVTTIPGAGLIFRDDFNSSSSLGNWAFDNAEGRVSAGILRVTNTADSHWGIVGREMDPPITSWDVATRLGRQADTIQTALVFVVADPGERSTEVFRILIGTRVLDWGGGDTETVNYGLQVFFEPEGREPDWYYINNDIGAFRGISDAINDGPGEFTDITVRVQDGIFAALAGEETLFEASVGRLSFGDAITEITQVHLWTLDPALTAPSLLDWIEVNGVPTGSSTANADHDNSFRLSPSNLTREGAIREASAAAREIPFQICPPRGCR